MHAFVRSLRLLGEKRASLIALFDAVGGLDAARSIANFRAGTPTSTPNFTSQGSPIVVNEIVHPLVDGAIANHARLERSIGWLIMGSNMSGKSTFLRAVALGAVLAQSIGCVTAKAYSAPLLDVRTLVYVQDDVLVGKSHFLAEACAARDLLVEEVGGIDRLCIVDELFRGTNTDDRVSRTRKRPRRRRVSAISSGERGARRPTLSSGAQRLTDRIEPHLQASSPPRGRRHRA